MTHQSQFAAYLQPRLSRRSVIQASAAMAGLLFLPSCASGAAKAATLETPQGKINGMSINGVRSFKGLAYGQSTGGKNRFLPPKPAEGWTGTFDATAVGAPCHQRNTDYPAWIDPVAASEDCLKLNVWAPEDADKLPVMVWIHGGGFASGSGGLPLYDGAEMARKGGVILVTVNHRLNIYGYTYLGSGDPRFETSSNAGQLDLVEALRWIRTSIASFGGDPENVTIFGESGGGAKISALMAMQVARGLFHKAIVQSGSSLTVADIASGEETATAVYANLGLQHGDFDALQAMSAERLNSCFNTLAPGTMTASGGRSHYFGPVGDNIVLPEKTWTPSAPALSADIPLLVGSNLHESVSFLDRRIRTPPTDDLTLADLVAQFSFGNSISKDRASELIQHYRELSPDASRLDLLVRITTDAGFWLSANMQAERKAEQNHAPAYVYEFNWETPCFGGEWSLHAIEIPFIFGNLEYASAWDGEDNDQQRAAADPSGARFAVADQMLEVWTTFARTGNPSTETVGDWSPYSEADRNTMVLGKEPHLVSDLRGEHRIELSRP